MDAVRGQAWMRQGLTAENLMQAIKRSTSYGQSRKKFQAVGAAGDLFRDLMMMQEDLPCVPLLSPPTGSPSKTLAYLLDGFSLCSQRQMLIHSLSGCSATTVGFRLHDLKTRKHPGAHLPQLEKLLASLNIAPGSPQSVWKCSIGQVYIRFSIDANGTMTIVCCSFVCQGGSQHCSQRRATQPGQG